MEKMNKIKDEFGRLVEIMEKLRSDDGCPWDREQTHQSLRQFLLEETYEVLETIDEENYDELKYELGDLLLQVIFHAQIAQENRMFDIGDVLKAISDKLIHRHPNVFGDVQIKSAEEQIVNWEKMKHSEGKKSVIDGVPKELSALLRAHRIQSKAATVGFDWETIIQVWDKVKEELAEFETAIESKNQAEIEDEFGDILFTLVNLSRFINVNPEDAMRATTEKFIKRFKLVEQEIKKQGKLVSESSLDELDAIWDRIKVAANNK
ncbi:nucleoside triphosphate pyrophosphohydrolase [candidate division KSB1 bacterium]|nr:nucleoside triphosphate pyrophosphohydrolase [candidate division KSB1 bacterium]